MIALYMVVFCIGNSADNIRQKCLVLCSPPKCRAFIVILCIMLHNTKQKFSTKVLVEAKEVVRSLQEQTAEMTEALAVMDLMNDEGKVPFDREIIRECSQMMAVFNRLMFEQEAKLRHIQMMQIADARADRMYSEFRKGVKTVSVN